MLSLREKRRFKWAIVVTGLCAALLGLVWLTVAERTFTATQARQNAQFARGDVFVAVNDGRIQWRRANGTLVQTLDTGESGQITGMAFDKDANLYATNFFINKVHRFSPVGLLLEHRSSNRFRADKSNVCNN